MARRGYLDTSVGQIHYRTEGDGPPVLFIHQFAQSSLEYSRVCPIIGKRYRTIAIDNIGYGSSDAGPASFTIKDYARLAVECLDALGIERASIVGHHGGAVVSVEVAVAYPERVEKVVLSGCPGPGDIERLRAKIMDPEWLAKKLTYDREGDFLRERWFVYRSWVREGAAPEVWYPAFVSSLLPSLLTGRYDAMHIGHYACLVYDIVARLPLIKRPTLMIKNTREYFVHELDKTRELLPGSRLAVIEGGTHYVTLDRPEEWASAVLAFLDDTSA